MKRTSDKAFVDSNLLIYLYSETEPDEKLAVQNLFGNRYDLVISNQVLAEVCSVLGRKFNVLPKQLAAVLSELSDNFTVVAYTGKTVHSCLNIIEKHRVGFYDALLLATASEFGCRTFFSEDMNHSQAVGNLKIVNPFVQKI